jgi:murein DD-endopeptidase MepM/ murein hydrolase activator NlpD
VSWDLSRSFAWILLASTFFVNDGGPAASPAQTVPSALTRADESSTVHTPPVEGRVIDPFRPPDEPWLPGNRGIEYETRPGEVVRASADGVVTFAGSVAGSFFVTVRHDGTLVTTVGFVGSVVVSVGDLVQQGSALAVAGDSIHFTARRSGEYIDPELLYQRFAVVVRLILGPS